MEAITVREIMEVVGGHMLGDYTDLDREITRVETDSRTIHDGSLFVPLSGERFDGHAYINSALEGGAAGCFTQRERESYLPGKCYIKVDSTQKALRDLARHYKKKFSIPFIGITGSVGKTTTKDMIAAVLAQKYRVLKTAENFNNDIGVPLTLLRLDHSHQAAVIETGMNHFGEIRYLGEMVRPDIAVISNIGDAHIEFLGSREGILKAKAEILENLRPGGTVILNGDDALLNTLTPPFETLRCGQGENCAYRVTEIADHGVDGITCCLTTPREEYHLTIPAPGEHMVYSASMAAAIGEKLGLTAAEIARGVACYAPTGSRMRVLRLAEERTVLDDCYNANPQSVTAALEILAKTDCAQRVAVLGDMGELGELTAQAHYNMGALAVMLGIDLVIAIGTHAARIAEGVECSGGQVQHFATKEEALPTIRAQLTPQTAMLIKASHAMRFGQLVEALEQSYDRYSG